MMGRKKGVGEENEWKRQTGKEESRIEKKMETKVCEVRGKGRKDDGEEEKC